MNRTDNFNSIRPYRTADAKTVRYIAHSDFKDDAMNAVCAVRCDYFIDFEPEHGFVACDEFDKPVGYILCSVNKDRFWHLYPEYISQLKRMNRKMYSEQNQNFKQLSNLPQGYSARFVINVLPSFQGKGKGKALVQRLVGHLSGMHVDGMHAVADSDSLSAFYERLGFDKLLRINKKFTVYGLSFSKLPANFNS